MATKLNFGDQITLQEAAHLLSTVGHLTTFLLEGEPGIGKSSILKMMAEKPPFKKTKTDPGYHMSYIDCTNLDLGDIAMPCVEMENGTRITHYAPNARFGIQHKRPCVVMLDELTKAMEPVKNMLLPTILEHRIGDVPLPEGSIVFATGNLTRDGVGDNLKPHARNRISVVRIKKPQAFKKNEKGELQIGEWGEWAMANGIIPEILAWSQAFPHAFASYMDSGQGDNPYIYQPGKVQTAFVTPRSLEKASNILKCRTALGMDVTIAALAGCVGEAAARDLVAYTHLADKLPTWDKITNTPKSVPVPDDPAALCILVFSAVMNVEKSSMNSWMEYCIRMKKETQALFAISVVKSPKTEMAMNNKAFTEFAMRNSYLFG